MDIVILILVVMVLPLIIMVVMRAGRTDKDTSGIGAVTKQAIADMPTTYATAKAALAQKQAFVDALRQRLKELGWPQYLITQSQADIVGLGEILEQSDQIEAAVPGRLDKAKGLLIATPSRLLFVDRTFLKARVEGFTYDSISSVQYQSGPFSTTLAFLVVNRHLKMTGIPNDLSAHMIAYVRQRIEQRASPAPAATPSPSSPLADLERLADLHARKILTDDEFQAQKQKLLNQ